MEYIKQETVNMMELGEVTKQTRIYTLPFMEQAVKLETQFEYDSWGRTLNMTYPDGEKVTYEYDYGGMLKKVSGIKGNQTYGYIDSIQYDKFGAKKRIGYNNKLVTIYNYNPQNLRLISQSIVKSPATEHINYMHISYTYDPKGNITGINTLNSKVSEFSANETFVYDTADQLISASGNNGSLYTLSMSYGNYGRIHTSNTTFTDPKINGNTQQISTSYAYLTTDAPSNNFAPVSANNGNISFEYGINGSMRKCTAPDKTEYYLYNGYDQMKAYSKNKIKYGYYNYDDAGQRMYKAVLNIATSQTNRLGVNILDVESLMLYPNGYINVNQDGNYTKHYYADAARIASKIGTGFADSISGGVVGNTLAYDVMINELGEATNDTIDNIVYAFGQIRYLEGDSNKYENALYFYHGNHLSSTQIVTDIDANVAQAVLYTPWGTVISEYKADWMLDTIPRYLFNGKELDEESGMYYYSARYYAPPTFISRDECFEDYPTLSPYNYCGNNPVKYIDPDGRKIKLADNFKGAMKNIAMIAATSRGQQVLNTMIGDNNTFTFNSTFFTGSSTYDFTTRTASYVANPLTKDVYGGFHNSMLAMAHEMFHGLEQSLNPNLSAGKHSAGKFTYEPRAVSFTNYLRQAYNLSPLQNKYAKVQGNFHQYNNLYERITDFSELGGNQEGTSYGFSYTKTITTPAKGLFGKASKTSTQYYMTVSRDSDNNVTYKIYNNKKDYDDATKDW